MSKMTFEERAITWFVTDEKGKEEKPLRFMYKALIKGYKEVDADGVHICKLSLRWFKEQVSPEDWKAINKYICQTLAISLTSTLIMSYAYAAYKPVLRNPRWSPAMNDAVAGILAILIAKLYQNSMIKIMDIKPPMITTGTDEPNDIVEEGGDIDDDRVPEVS